MFVTKYFAGMNLQYIFTIIQTICYHTHAYFMFTMLLTVVYSHQYTTLNTFSLHLYRQ